MNLCVKINNEEELEQAKPYLKNHPILYSGDSEEVLKECLIAKGEGSLLYISQEMGERFEFDLGEGVVLYSKEVNVSVPVFCTDNLFKVLKRLAYHNSESICGIIILEKNSFLKDIEYYWIQVADLFNLIQEERIGYMIEVFFMAEILTLKLRGVQNFLISVNCLVELFS